MAKRGHYGKWSKMELELAIAAYRNGDASLNKCAKQYNVPKATLKRHLESKNVVANEDCKAMGRTTTFTLDMENEIADHILKFEECLYGLSMIDVRKIAFEFAERNEIPHNFNKNTKMEGKKWLYAFLARNPKISLRKPENTSLARAKGFNKDRVWEFFDLLEKLVDKYKINSTSIFNVDESGYSTVQKNSQKILAKKGKKQVGFIESGERGVNTTIVCCVNAAGSYVPPMILFKRKRDAPELRNGAPPGSLVTASDTGYSDLFLQWLKHFKANISQPADKHVLLLLDGHSTHSKNLHALEYARENKIIMLQLPSHTTHRLQPLDVTFFSPLQQYYLQSQQRWLRSNPGQAITPFHVSALLSEAYGRAATVGNAISAFKSPGIWPVDRFVFNDSHFSASEVVNEDFSSDTDAATRPNQNVSSTKNLEIPPSTSDYQPQQSSNVKTVSSVSNSGKLKTMSPTTSKTLTKKINVTIEEISPLPRGIKLSERRKRGTQKAVELTSSPYKNYILERQRITKRSAKAKLEFFQQKDKKRGYEKVGEEKNWYCIICKESDVIDMIQCMTCKSWVHEVCANAHPGIKKYYCDYCQNKKLVI